MQYIKKAVALCLVLLLFVGCQSTEQSPSIVYPFTAQVHIKGKGLTADGILTASLLGCYTLEMTNPVSMKGLTFSCQNGKTQVEWDSWLSEREIAIPATGVFTQITAALDGAARRERPQHLTEETRVYRVDGHTVEWERAGDRLLRILLQDGTQVTVQYQS